MDCIVAYYFYHLAVDHGIYHYWYFGLTTFFIVFPSLTMTGFSFREHMQIIYFNIPSNKSFFLSFSDLKLLLVKSLLGLSDTYEVYTKYDLRVLNRIYHLLVIK